MRILFLSFYYPPDLSAGSFRATALVNALREAAPDGSTIDLVTTLPNRYASFSASAPERENHDGLRVTRIGLGKHRSGKVDQALAALGYFASAARHAVANGPYDAVVATSGRLMTAATGSLAARLVRAPLYLDIRDIFAELSREILPGPLATILSPVFSAIERWTIRRASLVNLVSRGFEPYFAKRYPGQRVTFLTNGVDEEFITSAPSVTRARPASPGKPLSILYAGNIGEGQGLEFIVPQLAHRLKGKARIRVVGDGGRREVLERAIRSSGVDNVELHLPMKRAELLKAYQEADVLFLHLNDYDAFKRVLPSKLFEYGALGKPVWAGLGGYSAEFVRTEIRNSAVFPPCDVEAAMRTWNELRIEDTPRNEFIAKYDRRSISRVMAADILSVAREAK